MSDLLTSVVGGGGPFVAREAASGFLNSGVTGTILTLTPPAGQRVQLTHLSTDTGFEQTGISVVFGATTLVTAKILAGPNPEGPDRFSVGSFNALAAGNPPSGNFPLFLGKYGEVVTIVKDAGNTAQIVWYGYEYGE